CTWLVQVAVCGGSQALDGVEGPDVAVSRDCEKETTSLFRGPRPVGHGNGTGRDPRRHCASLIQDARGRGDGAQRRRCYAMPPSLSWLRQTLPRHGDLPPEVLPTTATTAGAVGHRSHLHSQLGPPGPSPADSRSTDPTSLATT